MACGHCEGPPRKSTWRVTGKCLCHAEEVDQGHRRGFFFLATRKAQFIKDLMDNSILFFSILVIIFVVWATFAMKHSNVSTTTSDRHQSGKGLLIMQQFKEIV